ncbi:MAG TPA: universal stress protein, partial [Solirubrobacteraceae bacterium]
QTDATDATDEREARQFADVLCAVDGTRRSYTAVEQGASLAGPGGELTLLAVTAQSGAGAFRSAAISAARVDDVLDRAKEIARDAGARASTLVDAEGPPAKTIARRAAGRDLLALGAPVSSWLGRLLVGDVAFELLESCTTPLLMARPAPGGRPFAARIVLASDGLEDSDRLAEIAGRIALEHDGEVTVVHASADGPSARSRVEAQARSLESILPGRCELIVRDGGAREAIVEVARASEASLIVLGSRRRDGLHPLGGVSRRVVHDVSSSLLLVPPGA